MISKACKEAEKWKEKDILYIVGLMKKKSKQLKSLCMVYGTEYCASEECYKKIRKHIKDGVELIEGVTFSETQEVGRINSIDPLGITKMRIRGM